MTGPTLHPPLRLMQTWCGYDVTVLNSLPKFYDWNAISLSWIF